MYAVSILKKIYLFFSDLFITFAFAGAIFVIVYIFLFRPFQVNGQSMYPTYHHGEYVLTNRIALKFGPPERGDVVVFHSPQSKVKDFIKRVIAVPGNKIKLSDGHVFVNGKKLQEQKYLPQNLETFGGSFLHESEEITVPKNMYFVMGDNRRASSDSREWGFVKVDEVVGKSLIVYWPPDRFRVINHISYDGL